jgi:FixJ family two-component response regulator
MARIDDAVQEFVVIIGDDESVRESLKNLFLSFGIFSNIFGSEQEFHAANLSQLPGS